MRGITRRELFEIAAGATSAVLLSACTGQISTPSPSPSASAPAGNPSPARLRGGTVQNENRPDRNIRYFKPFIPPAPQDWTLAVGGLVRTPLTLSLADLQLLPYLEQESRMKCVECWSFKSRWGGFALASLLDQAHPETSAQHVRFTCADGYWEVLPLEELLRDRVLFSYRMDGEFLADEDGSPLRLIVPWKYGYKGPKCIVSVDLVTEAAPGYWSTVGPYTVSGEIEIGFDTPQETGERVQITAPATELMY